MAAHCFSLSFKDMAILNLKYVAEKGGTLQKTIQLKEQFVPKKNTHKRAIPSPGS